jgi:hypothetical protein
MVSGTITTIAGGGNNVPTNGALTVIAGNGIAGYSGDGGPATSATVTTCGGWGAMGTLRRQRGRGLSRLEMAARARRRRSGLSMAWRWIPRAIYLTSPPVTIAVK